MTKTIPNPINIALKILLVFFLFNRKENKKCAIAGMNKIPMVKAENSANVLVQANGLNNFPSEACIAKTGKKLTTVVATAVIIAEATSVVAS